MYSKLNDLTNYRRQVLNSLLPSPQCTDNGQMMDHYLVDKNESQNCCWDAAPRNGPDKHPSVHPFTHLRPLIAPYI